MGPWVHGPVPVGNVHVLPTPEYRVCTMAGVNSEVRAAVHAYTKPFSWHTSQLRRVGFGLGVVVEVRRPYVSRSPLLMHA